MKYIVQVVDLILYSNILIAYAALCMYLQTLCLISGNLYLNNYSLCLFAGTVALYTSHRLIGLGKLSKSFTVGRFATIARWKQGLLIWMILAIIAAIYFFLHLDWSIQLWMLIPALLSVSYVIPFLSGKRRLRDVNFTKIFIIALAWAWLTGLIPCIQYKVALPFTVLICLERAAFIFAITIPFDVRDLEVDAQTSVQTIPGRIGLKASKWLSWAILLLMLLAAATLYILGYYDLTTLTALFGSFLLTGLLIQQMHPRLPDQYFTGLVDGTMIVQLVLILLLQSVFYGS